MEITSISPAEVSTSTTSTTAAPNASTLAKAVEFWRKFDSVELHRQLDTQAMQVLSNQRSTVDNRRKLADDTKQFKRLAEDSEKLQQVPRLLRSYQVEIDDLSQRLKSTETWFLGLVSQVTDLVDPLQLLLDLQQSQGVRAHLHSVELENQQLRADLQASQLELKSRDLAVANQSRLQDRVGLLERQLQIAETRAANTADVSALRDQIQFQRERESDLLQQIQVVEQKLKQAQEQPLLSPSSSSAAAFNKDYLAQIEVLERELAHFKLQSIQLQRDIDAMQTDAQGKYQKQMQEVLRSLEIAETTQHDLQAQLAANTQESEQRITLLGVQEQKLRAEIGRLNSIIDSQKDYELISRELVAYKSLEFGADMDAGGPLTLEALSLQKTRRIQSQLADLQLKFDETSAQLQESMKIRQELQLRADDQQALITRLEADMLKLNGPANEILASQSIMSQVSTSPVESAGSKASLLQIITAQRDRFHARTTELEIDNKELQVKMSDMLLQMNSLSEDNLRLFEKVKYLTSFNAEASRHVDFGRTGAGTTSSVTSQDSKYESMYENKLDPFSQFSRKEQRRRMSKMEFSDRFAVQISRFFLSTKHSRVFLVIYTALLHLLVFGMLVYLTESSSMDSTSVQNLESLKRWIANAHELEQIKEVGFAIKEALGTSFATLYCV
eukprot:Partr_v1_DN28485_c0_g1_i4_m41362 putative Cut-like homeobox